MFVTLIALPACSDRFTPAPPPDLRKDPYDFSVVVPPYTGPGSDMVTASAGGGGNGGGGGMVPHDLAGPHDLELPPTD
jgi:hypothetical protein